VASSSTNTRSQIGKTGLDRIVNAPAAAHDSINSTRGLLY
jgi:hypothetical protein